MDTTTMAKKADAAEAARGAEQTPAQKRTIDIVSNRIESSDLFVATKEITIGHEGEIYRLRLTALNKLILTK